jgi:hypothetical protein
MDALARSGLAWSFAASVLFGCAVLFVFDGRDYYAAPLEVRVYGPGHALFRPSGPVGQTFGIVGALMMLVPFLYMARKRVSWLKGAGSLKTWLEIHLFCGVVGPVLVTFHTAFKFGGLIAAAYWSMVIVVLSGFIGRYLYVRIPRSIRGTELTRKELDARAEALRTELAVAVASPVVLQQIDALERSSIRGFISGDLLLRSRLRRLDREFARTGVGRDLRERALALVAERTTLLRRIANLQKTKSLFELWHVFHLPLVYVLLVIVAVHVAVTVYLGYVPFRW